MTDFIGAIGLMTIGYAIVELLGIFTRDADKNSRSVLSIILAPIMYFLMLCTAPVGFLVMLHDKRTEKIHRDRFWEERKPVDEINARQQKRMEEEIRILTNQLNEAKKRPSYQELFRSAHDRGYQEGYRDGQHDHAAGINFLDDLED